MFNFIGKKTAANLFPSTTAIPSMVHLDPTQTMAAMPPSPEGKLQKHAS
jgi:hypothetical protein